MGRMGFTAHYDYLVYDMVVANVPGPEAVEAWARRLLDSIGVEIHDRAVHVFPTPVEGAHAYTLMLVLSASHMAVHTAPEFGWVHLAFAFCDGYQHLETIDASVRAFFRPTNEARPKQIRCGADVT